MRKFTSKGPLGVTPLETLAAIAVVAGLAGVAPSMLAGAKIRTANQGEISRLHDLGVAQGIYTADTGGVPMSTLPLVKGGYVRSELCASPLDTTADGLANALTEELGIHSKSYLKLGTSYRSSFVGLREFGFPYDWMRKYIQTDNAGGWLVSLTTSKRINAEGTGTWFSGNYRRLMLDGSVKDRRHMPVNIGEGNEVVNAEHDLFLFLDGTNEWKKSFVSGSR